ncbi:MAG: TRAP transporter substrate-binding protein [Hyphomicrobiaceae bacterium]
MRFALRALTVGVSTLAVFGFAAGQAAAQKRINWKMQSAFGSTVPLVGTSGLSFAKKIEEMSDGKFKIKFFEPGALVPPFECFDAVAKGSVDLCWTSQGYYTGKYAALAFHAAVPFGPGLGEYVAWKRFGNGDKLQNELFGRHGLKFIDAYCHGPETSGWFRNEIKSTDELKGLKMRFFGLGAQVMQKFGVSTQLLAGGDIYPALERGVIDATEFSMPVMDIKYGFYQIAKNNYFPGWHQQTSCGGVLISQKLYDSLPNYYKAMIQTAAWGVMLETFAESEAVNPEAMLEMQKKHGVKVHRWSDADLAKFEQGWLDVIKEQSAKDADFKKVADDYLAFREKYRIWGSAQSLNSTYLKK